MNYFFSSLPEEKTLQDLIRKMRLQRKNIPYESNKLIVTSSIVGYCVRMFPVPDSKYQSESSQYHADCILPGGGLASYGYDPMASLGNTAVVQDKLEKGLEGTIVFDHKNNDKFTDANRALLNRCLTSFLLFSVPFIQAKLFTRFWQQPPRTYNRLSNNCSSVPYLAFREAGILTSPLIPPITPRRLYSHLKTKISSDLIVHEGCGFLGMNFGKGELEIRIPKCVS